LGPKIHKIMRRRGGGRTRREEIGELPGGQKLSSRDCPIVRRAGEMGVRPQDAVERKPPGQ